MPRDNSQVREDALLSRGVDNGRRKWGNRRLTVVGGCKGESDYSHLDSNIENIYRNSTSD